MNYDPNTGQPINNNQQPVQQGNSTNGFAIAGLIVAILVSALIGLILSIVGLSKSKKLGSGKGLSIAGIIVSIVKLILEAIMIAIFIGLFSGLFNMATNYEESCAKVTSCGPANSSGYAECKYKEGSITYTISCPVDKTTKKTTTSKVVTTTKPTTTSGAQEFALYSVMAENYYADKFYLKSNNIYARPTDKGKEYLKSKSVEKITIGNDEVYKIIINIKKAFLVEEGQTEYQYLYIVDGIGKTYLVHNLESEGKNPFGFTELKNVTDIDKVYSLSGEKAKYSVFVNKNGQLVPTSSGYLEVDKKNGIYENKVGSDIYKLEEVNKDKKDSKTIVTYNVYKNGTKLTNQANVEVSEDFSNYDDQDVIFVSMCSNDKFGVDCNEGIE